MAVEKPKTITDDQIVTERKHPRRSFLTVAGAILAGAATIVTGAMAQEKDSDAKKSSDPDAKKSSKKSSKKKSDKKSEKAADPDAKK